MFKGLGPKSKKAVLATLIISSVMMLGSVTAPLLGYIMMNYPDQNVFLILQIPSFVGMIVSFVIGPLALKINVKYLMVVSAGAALVYFLLFAIIGGGNFTALLVGAAIMGICMGSGMVLTSTIWGQFVTDPDQRANFVAIGGAVMNGGGAIINVIGGIIAAQNGGLNWANAYWLGLLIVPALIVFMIMMPKEPDAVDAAAFGGPGGPGGPPPMIGAQKINVKVYIIIVLGLFASLGMMGFLLNVGTYLTVELAEYGYTSVHSGTANSIWTIMGVVAGFAFPFVIKFAKNWIPVIGNALGVLGFFLIITQQSSIGLIYLGAAIAGLGINIGMPFVMGKMMAYTPIRLIPVVMSVNMGLMSLIMTFTPNILAAMAAPLGGLFAHQILIGLCILAFGAVANFFLFVVWKDKEPAGPPPAGPVEE